MPLPVPLRNDVRTLGKVLGNVIKQHAGAAMFDRVEQVRSLSKQARLGDAEAAAQLERTLSDLSSDEAFVVARSFSLF